MESEHIIEISEDMEDDFEPNDGRLMRRYEKLAEKNKTALDGFLGRGRRVNQVCIFPRYYGELLTWSLNVHMVEDGWKVIRTLGYHGREPVFVDVRTDINKKENLLRDGQMLVVKNGCRLVITVDINMQWRNSVLVEGPAKQKDAIETFVAGVLVIAKDRNFYRGKKMEFCGEIRLLDIKDRSWDSVILDEEIKEEIRVNSIGFLRQKDRWIKYGIPLKRGILLAGEPGTGKTAICKTIAAEAGEISCIVTSAYGLEADGYITELYELAQDLSPAIVFIEDIDLIGQSRNEYGYRSGPALLSLLTVLDGVEERQGIVTIATTNHLQMLDKALSERPSRFDRVIKILKPSYEKRLAFINLINQKIPLDETTQSLVAMKSDNCTLAQLQEVIYGLVIGIPDIKERDNGCFRFDVENVTKAVSRVKNGNTGQQIGFISLEKHNGEYEASINIRRQAAEKHSSI